MAYIVVHVFLNCLMIHDMAYIVAHLLSNFLIKSYLMANGLNALSKILNQQGKK